MEIFYSILFKLSIELIMDDKLYEIINKIFDYLYHLNCLMSLLYMI